MALFDYLKQIRRFIRDPRMTTIDEENLIAYVNRARREVAMRTQCVRVLTPISGAVVTCNVITGGTNYSPATVCAISSPDFPSGMGMFPNGDQATATPIIIGGVITGVSIAYGGAGYYQPTIEFIDTTGSGATATLTVSPINVMEQGREVYKFSDVDLSQFPGVQSVYAVKSVSVLYANWRYTLACPSFSSYQASLRSFPSQFEYVPFYMAQFGRGTAGTFFMYPLPAGPWQMEWDCYCLPSDLIDDQSEEAVPDPFTDGVAFLAAYYAYLELQNMNAARFYKQEFSEWMNRYAVATLPGRVGNPYGRVFW